MTKLYPFLEQESASRISIPDIKLDVHQKILRYVMELIDDVDRIIYNIDLLSFWISVITNSRYRELVGTFATTKAMFIVCQVGQRNMKCVLLQSATQIVQKYMASALDPIYVLVI